MACPSCGTENQPDRKFCRECGTALSRRCPSCATPNEPGDRFCGECGVSLEETPERAATHTVRAAATTRERRVVTVLFCDLTGFTSYAERRDPEEVRGVLSRYFELATEIIERFGGTVEKFIGDAVMGVWGAEITREDDAERAVRAGLELVDAVAKLAAEEGVLDVALRVGVLTGEAAVGDESARQGMVVGDVVNTASRLQSEAEPGTVLVGEATYRLCRQAIAFEPLGERSVRGRSLPVEAWRALQVVSFRGGEGRVEGLEPPFVGRAEELRLLKDQLHATGREGTTRLVAITGLGGIGKTRLVWEFLKYSDGLVEDIYVHQGRSPSYGDGIAFWALAEMVRQRARIAETDDAETAGTKLREVLDRYVSDEQERAWLQPRLAGLLGMREMPSGQRGELFSAFRRFFERIAEHGTTVLVFEDLQWADAALLDFVEELPEWSRRSPILIIALARPELADRRPTWGSARRNVISLHLGPVTDDEMKTLIGGIAPGLPDPAVDIVRDHAAGIPLYAVEIVRTLLADGRLIPAEGGSYQLLGDPTDLAVPDSLQAAIGARLDRLEDEDRNLVQHAAVLGLTFTVDVLAALTGRDADDVAADLANLVRRELLTFDTDPRSPERGQYGFVQSLIREVAYARLSREDRRDRHLRIAQELELRGDVELAGVVADHYVRALRTAARDEVDEGLRDRALEALDRAAERAEALHSHEEVLSYCEQAGDLAAGTGGEPDWWERAAIAAHALARGTEAEDHARRIIERAEEDGDDARALRAHLLLGRIIIERHDAPRALDVLRPVAERWTENVDQDTIALVALIARAHLLSGDLREAADVAERALIAAEPLDLLPVLADALITRGTALGDLGRRREGIALLEAATKLAEESGLTHIQLRAHGNLAYLLARHDLRQTTVIYERAFAESRRLGERGWMIHFAHNLNGLLFHLGRWNERAELAAELEDGDAADDRDRAALRLGRTLISALRGDVDAEGAQGVVEEVRELAEADPDPQGRRNWYVQQAWIALVTGDPERAYDLSMQTIDFDRFGHASVYEVATVAAVLIGDAGRLREVVAAVDRVPTSEPAMVGASDVALGGLALLDGDVPAAVGALDGVRERWSDSQILRGIALHALGIRAAGVDLGTPDPGAEGRSILEGLGANGFLERYPATDPAPAWNVPSGPGDPDDDEP